MVEILEWARSLDNGHIFGAVSEWAEGRYEVVAGRCKCKRCLTPRF